MRPMLLVRRNLVVYFRYCNVNAQQHKFVLFVLKQSGRTSIRPRPQYMTFKMVATVSHTVVQKRSDSPLLLLGAAQTLVFHWLQGLHDNNHHCWVTCCVTLLLPQANLSGLCTQQKRDFAKYFGSVTVEHLTSSEKKKKKGNKHTNKKKHTWKSKQEVQNSRWVFFHLTCCMF